MPLAGEPLSSNGQPAAIPARRHTDAGSLVAAPALWAPAWELGSPSSTFGRGADSKGLSGLARGGRGASNIVRARGSRDAVGMDHEP
jgi:hypothetical protein